MSELSSQAFAKSCMLVASCILHADTSLPDGAYLVIDEDPRAVPPSSLRHILTFPSCTLHHHHPAAAVCTCRLLNGPSAGRYGRYVSYMYLLVPFLRIREV